MENTDNYPLKIGVDGIVDGRGWRGEYWGKMMRGASMLVKYTKNEDIYKILKGEKEIDIKPHIKLSKLEHKEGRYYLKTRLASGVELNINPDLVFAAFKNFAGFAPDDIKVKRMAVYNEKMEKFR